MKNADMPAMPVPLNPGEKGPGDWPPDGLTKREHFAALAMQAMLSNSSTDEFRPAKGNCYEFLAAMAVNQADALLAALESS